jgi:ABC-type sugar transport system substrate-binding protein
MKKNARAIAIAAATVALALLSAGCGGSKSASTASDADVQAGIAKAKTVLADASKSVASVDAPTSSPAMAKDKFVVTIPCSYAAEGCKRSADGFADAAQHVGWRTQNIDPAGDPEKMRQAVETAIRLKADGILLAATPPSVVKAAVQEAKAKGIKVINSLESPNELFDANSTTDHIAAGRASAAYTTVASEGKAKVIVINDPEFQSVTDWHQGFTDGLKEFCPGCQVVKDFDFQIANLQTQLPTQFQAVLQANPTANFVWAAYDPVALAIEPVIARSPQAGKIQIVSNNGDSPALTDIKTGNKALTATVAYPIEWQSYVALDQMNRLFAGQKPESTVNVPIKVMSKDNITSVPWNGDVDWKSAYLNLWKANGAAG